MTIELLRFLYGCRTRAYEQQQATVRTHNAEQRDVRRFCLKIRFIS